MSEPEDKSSPEDFVQSFLLIERNLARDLEGMEFDGVEYVYNPIDYAVETHCDYLTKYQSGPRGILFLGMNPGPWGMLQTGVPFGQVAVVRDWLHVDGAVKTPAKQHPKRPVQGLECERREVSGERFWTLVKEEFGLTEFLSRCAVYNHCPLGFLGASGKNITPPDMKKAVKEAALAACDQALIQVLNLLQVHTVVGIGRFAVQRAEKVLRDVGLADKVQVHFLNHPSPASASANKGGGWNKMAAAQLREMGLLPLPDPPEPPERQDPPDPPEPPERQDPPDPAP